MFFFLVFRFCIFFYSRILAIETLKYWNWRYAKWYGNQFEETKKNTEKSWKSNSSRKPQNLQNKRFMENFNAPLASLEVRTQNGLQHAKWVIYKSRFFEFGQDVKSTYGFFNALKWSRWRQKLQPNCQLINRIMKKLKDTSQF